MCGGGLREDLRPVTSRSTADAVPPGPNNRSAHTPVRSGTYALEGAQPQRVSLGRGTVHPRGCHMLLYWSACVYTSTSLPGSPSTEPFAGLMTPGGPLLPVGLTLAVEPLVKGVPTTLAVTGADPNASVSVWRGGLGGLSCPADLGGGCVPVRDAALVVEGTADGTGGWTGAWDVPADETTGDYPVLVATDGRLTSLVVVRRVFDGAPADTFTTDGFDVGSWWEEVPVELPPGDYFDLVQEGMEVYQVAARGNETVAVSVVFHNWIEVGDWYGWASPPRASPTAEPIVTIDEPGFKDFDMSFSGLSLASGMWEFTFGDEYGEASGYYDLQVRVTAPAEPRTWYSDTDGDAYGDAEAPIEAAVAPEGATWRAQDCDDLDQAVHPEAWDVCEDGLDQDCTGTDKPCRGAILQDGLPVSSIASQHALATGWGAGALGDVDGDGVAEVWFRDNDVLTNVAIDPGVWGGGPEVANDDDWGQTVVGDFNHDGVRDVAYGRGLIGREGEVKITATPTDPASVVGAAWATLVGPSPTDSAGESLAAGGDVDGDGFGDLVVGGNTRVWLVTAVTPGTASLDLASTATLTPFGRPTAPADLDGDGLADLLVAGPVATVFHGPVSGTNPPPGSTISLTGGIAYNHRDIGDTDADGLGEVLLVGTGEIWLFENPQGDLDEGDATVSVQPAGVGTIVDLDRDGIDDLVVTHSDPSGYEVHLAIAYGPVAPTLVLPADADVVLQSAEYEQTGQGLSSADYDGNGTEDLAVETYASTTGDPLGWDRWYATDFVLTSP